VHGYIDADLVDQPSLQEIWPAFRSFIGDSIVVGHNAWRFDVPVLRRLTTGWDGLQGVTFFDSLPLARQLLSHGGCGLADLAARFGIDTGHGHHALDDSICLANVFERLQAERLCKARMTCLPSLLDAVSLGIALEGATKLSGAAELIFRKGARKALGRFSDILDLYEQECTARQQACPPVAEIIDRLGGAELQKKLRRESSPEDWHPEVYGRLKQLIAFAEGETLEDSIRSFLDRLALSRSDGPGLDANRVSLLTFHATKGLEFSRVYVIGVEDAQLPGITALTENREDEIQEARRLLYVAMTRTKDRLCLTHCRQRNGKSTGGTKFLSEMGLATARVRVPMNDSQN
jgi:hypothetical protein